MGDALPYNKGGDMVLGIVLGVIIGLPVAIALDRALTKEVQQWISTQS